jgi:hypothetical protein
MDLAIASTPSAVALGRVHKAPQSPANVRTAPRGVGLI